LFTERGITRDDGLSDPEPWHFVGDDFFGVRQRARQLSAQSNQQRTEVFRSLSYVSVVISKHGQSLCWRDMRGNCPPLYQLDD